MQHLFGIDIGGTTVKMGHLDFEGNLLDKWEIKTRTEDKGIHVLPDVVESLLAFVKQRNIPYIDIAGIGFGVPGPVVNNMVKRCVNLGWDLVDVKREVEALLPFTTKIVAANDANVAAYGELKKGLSGVENAVMLTLGTGVGGGVIVGGKPLSGTNGAAGELGHIRVDFKHNYKCNCGLCGCLETLTSATGVVRLYKDYYEQDGKKMPDDINCKVIFDNAILGDPLSLKVVEEFGHYLGLGAAQIAAVLDPECFIIGGGVSRTGQFLIDVVKKNYQKHAFHACKDTEFYLAKLGNDSGMVGAALLTKVE